jgi:hypothetical protein
VARKQKQATKDRLLDKRIKIIGAGAAIFGAVGVLFAIGFGVWGVVKAPQPAAPALTVDNSVTHNNYTVKQLESEAVSELKAEIKLLKLTEQDKDKLLQTQIETINHLVKNSSKTDITSALQAVAQGDKTKLLALVDDLINERKPHVRESAELYAKKGALNYTSDAKQALRDYEQATKLAPENSDYWN